jgi:tetratricopeptide (TPR) repeat protein
VLYNLACAEARFGRADDALEHLRQAVELEPRFLDNARDDGDLESIREDERFPS